MCMVQKGILVYRRLFSRHQLWMTRTEQEIKFNEHRKLVAAVVIINKIH